MQAIRITKKYALNPEVVSPATAEPPQLADIGIGLEAIDALRHVVGAACNLLR